MFFSEEKLFSDFLAFCHAQLETQDIDPVYPMLARIYQNLSQEEALWYTLLYVGYYDLGSATYAYVHTAPLTPLHEKFAHLACGSERRGFRGGDVSKHIESICNVVRPYTGLEDFFSSALTDNPEENWTHLFALLTRFWGNGRWAAYKTCEILMRVHGYPLQAPSMSNAYSSGPRKGLALFYPIVLGSSPQAVAQLDAQGNDLLGRARTYTVDISIEQLETLLCDFHALYEGRYYVGHDIDQMLSQLYGPPMPLIEIQVLFSLRKAIFPHAYLGELNGWHGPDRVRKALYKKTGRIVTR